MAFIRRVRTGSGATAVQIAEYAGGRQRIVTHVGSAYTQAAELGVLLERARELLADPAQGCWTSVSQLKLWRDRWRAPEFGHVSRCGAAICSELLCS